MSQQQHANTVQQWAQEAEDELEAVEEANEKLQDLRDEEFRDLLAEKFPQLRAWPGRTT